MVLSRAAIAVFAMATLAACEGASDSEPTYSSATTTDERGVTTTTTTIATEGGTATMRSGDGDVADLPAGFTIYPDATVVKATRFDRNRDGNGDGRGDGQAYGGALITMTSDATQERIIAFYRAQAKEAGIAIELELTTDLAMVIGGPLGENGTFSLTTSRGEGGLTTAQLMIGTGS